MIFDGSSIESVYKSLSIILNVDRNVIENYISNNEYRITVDGISRSYDNIEIDSFFEYLYGRGISDNELSKMLKIEKVTLFHLTSTTNKESFIRDGIMNLKTIFETSNGIKKYLIRYDIELKKVNSEYKIFYRGKEIDYSKHKMLKRRLSWDECINGFLFKDRIESNTNVEHLKYGPEFVQNIFEIIGNYRYTNNWYKDNDLYIIRSIVDLDDIDDSTFDLDIKDKVNKYKLVILKGLEFILFHKTNYWELDSNTIIFMKNYINIDSSRIIEISEVNNG
ncbi:hypothetical protein [Clostridium sp.]|uniref:hypothetical protein n=1 Tax=Clostridium sp. TaxID=1506 RepID=UPI0025C5CD23|nr:hypothetical protein [Clostridium sp.]